MALGEEVFECFIELAVKADFEGFDVLQELVLCEEWTGYVMRAKLTFGSERIFS